MPTRRSFIQIVPVAGVALLGARVAYADDLKPTDPQAVALGYVSDATKADKAKYPKYAAGQDCANCQLPRQGRRRDRPMSALRRQNRRRKRLVWLLGQESMIWSRSTSVRGHLGVGAQCARTRACLGEPSPFPFEVTVDRVEHPSCPFT